MLRLSEALSTPEYLVDLEDVTFSLRRGLSADRVRVAPATPGEPVLLAMDGATLHFALRPGEPLLRWVHGVDVQRVVLSALPRRSPSGRAALPTFGPVRMRCSQADILGTSFRDVSALVECRDSRLAAKQLRGDLSPPRFPAEVVEGEFSFGLQDGDISGTVAGNLNLQRIVPLLRACHLTQLPMILMRFAFPAEPAMARLRLEYAPAERHRELEVSLSATSFLYRDVPLLSGSATLVAEGHDRWDVIHVRDLQVERPEGSGRGTLEFDLVRHGLQFSANSTLDPKHLFGIIGVFAESRIEGWKCGAPAEVAASGYHAFAGSEASTDIRGVTRLPALTVHKVRFDNVEAKFEIRPDRYVIPDFTATLYGGACTLTGTIHRTPPGERAFSLEGSLRGAGSKVIIETATGRTSDDPGAVDLTLSLTGNLTTNVLRTLRGGGHVRVRDAQIYRMPLFAGLTDFMVRNVPGVDFVVSQNDLDAEFTVADYGLQFPRLRIEGGVFSISGDGDYWFTDHLDVGVQIHLLKQRTWVGRVLKVALFPVSKLFEMEATGPLASPTWASTTLKLRGRRKATDAQRGVLPPPESTEGAP